jgi:O-antigen ligase
VTRREFQFTRENAYFWALICFIGLVFLMGGGARGDIQSLILLRPLAALFLAFGLWRISRADLARLKPLFIIALAVTALALLHLIPLPPSVWQAMPGRELLKEIDSAAGLGAVWRPITLTPAAAWNAAYSLLIPLAALVLLARVSHRQLFGLVPALLVFGFASAVLGIAQAVGPMQSPLYLYNITNNGLAVGFFANRNHQAVLLATLFPMLAVYAATGAASLEKARLRFSLALGGVVLLIPLMLVTGSRAGLALGLVGIVALLLIYRRPEDLTPLKRKTVKIDPRIIVGAVIMGILGVISFFLTRAEAVNRAMEMDSSTELRFAVWPNIVDMAWKYFPVGSGMGSFVEAFQIDEPYTALRATYLNHAHNDWLEVFMTGGLPALLILGGAIAAWVWGSMRLIRGNEMKRDDLALARMGATVTLMLALASIADYPLRTPILALVITIAATWMISKPSGPASKA